MPASMTTRPDCELVAVCDIIPERADRAAERYGCQPFYSVREMLASGIQLDAVSVCSAGAENGGDHYPPHHGAARRRHPGAGRKTDLE